MFLLAVVTALFLVGLSIVRIDLDVVEYRNAWRGRYSLAYLQWWTGIDSVDEIEALAGRPGDDHLYEIPRERMRDIPWTRWWVGPHHPILNVLAAGALLWFLAAAYMTWNPPWRAFAAGAGYVGFCMLWELWSMYSFRPEPGDTRRRKDQLEERRIRTLLERAEAEALDMATSLQLMRYALKLELRQVERQLREELRDESNRLSIKAIYRITHGFFRWRLGRELAQMNWLLSRAEEDVAPSLERMLTRVRWKIHSSTGTPQELEQLRATENDLTVMLREVRGPQE